MRFDVVHHFPKYDEQLAAINCKLDRILQTQHQQLEQENKAMASLEEVLAEVTDEATKIDSLTTFMDGLKQQLADALSGANLPPAVQAKVDQVFSAVEANKAKVVAAIEANTEEPGELVTNQFSAAARARLPPEADRPVAGKAVGWATPFDDGTVFHWIRPAHCSTLLSWEERTKHEWSYQRNCMYACQDLGGPAASLASDDLTEVVRDADTEIGRYVLVEKQHYTKQVVPFPSANPRKKGRAA